jgi:hypothetical protein
MRSPPQKAVVAHRLDGAGEAPSPEDLGEAERGGRCASRQVAGGRAVALKDHGVLLTRDREHRTEAGRTLNQQDGAGASR